MTEKTEEYEQNLSFVDLETICNENFNGDYKVMRDSVEFGLKRARDENDIELRKRLEIDLKTINLVINGRDDETII